MCLFLGSGLESIAQGSGNIKLQNYYQYWSNKYYRLRQQVNLAAFVDYQDNRTTCLEAHGYGMLIYIYAFRLDEDTITYFKNLAEEKDLPYQSLINLYLRDCAQSHKDLKLEWQ